MKTLVGTLDPPEPEGWRSGVITLQMSSTNTLAGATMLTVTPSTYIFYNPWIPDA